MSQIKLLLFFGLLFVFFRFFVVHYGLHNSLSIWNEWIKTMGEWNMEFPCKLIAYGTIWHRNYVGFSCKNLLVMCVPRFKFRLSYLEIRITHEKTWKTLGLSINFFSTRRFHRPFHSTLTHVLDLTLHIHNIFCCIVLYFVCSSLVCFACACGDKNAFRIYL